MADNGNSATGFEFRKFATPRIIGGIVIAIVILWALSIIFSSSEGPMPRGQTETLHSTKMTANSSPSDHATRSTDSTHTPASAAAPLHSPAAEKTETTATGTTSELGHGSGPEKTHGATTQHETAADKPSTKTPATQPPEQPSTADDETARQGAASGAGSHTMAEGATSDRPSLLPARDVVKPVPKGLTFVEAAIKPLEYELEERWWGWRLNDLIKPTDNVNNFQMGVLEVTRRTIVALADRITRYGTTDAYDPNLEDSMNWIMVKAGSYWFPSAESKYREALDELRVFAAKLKAGKATFYTRSDNLIPLLATFEDLLGSCDTNLVKENEEDGSPVSFFSSDDYFFYSKGVANSMATVLEAVHKDFLIILESRHAAELLEHAIVACHRAANIDPWIILDRNLSSTFANHRANMAAPISHARFYLGQLIKTLST